MNDSGRSTATVSTTRVAPAYASSLLFCGATCCTRITFSRSVAMEDPIKHSQRMCRGLDKIFPGFTGKQRELMLHLCLVAYGSEIYDGVCEDAWLRTIIKLKTHAPGEDEHVLGEGTFEVMTGISNVSAPCAKCWNWLLEHEYLTAISMIEIRSNILPRKAYAERLRKLQESVVLGDESVVLHAEEGFCCISRRDLYPITSINQACLEEVLVLKEKWNESRRNTEKWDLTVHLRPNDVQRTVPIPPIDPGNVLPLRRINPDDVVSMEKGLLGAGTSAKVYKVSWRKGTYARKWYDQSSLGANEREYIKSKIMHPHLVHGFGYFENEDCQMSLLMELLDNDLARYANEVVRACSTTLVKPLFSRAEDTFDVLLQIASAVEHLHLYDVVHGDLKPGNILLDYFEVLGPGRRFLAKVTDFGDSKVIERGIAFKPVGYGTTPFAAPELLKLRQGLVQVFDHPKKIDVYGFGAVAHEILTGFPAYGGRDVREDKIISGKLKPSGCFRWKLLKWIMRFKAWKLLGLEERFPKELLKLVERCWELQPENRPDFSEIVEYLRSISPRYKSGIRELS